MRRERADEIPIRHAYCSFRLVRNAPSIWQSRIQNRLFLRPVRLARLAQRQAITHELLALAEHQAKFDSESTGRGIVVQREFGGGNQFVIFDNYKLKNGFGAWKCVRYTCKYDRSEDTIALVSVE